MTKQKQIFEMIRDKVGKMDLTVLSIHYADSNGDSCIEHFYNLSDRQAIFILMAVVTAGIKVDKIDLHSEPVLTAPLSWRV